MRVARLTINSGATGTSFDGYLPAHAEGFAGAIKVKIPNVALTPTATLNIYDKDGDLVFTKAAIPENAVTVITSRGENKDIPVFPGAKINLTFTTDPGVATHNLTFYLDDRK